MTISYDGMVKVAQLTENLDTRCSDCTQLIGGMLDEKINHYLTHGWKILHIGTETQRGDGGLQHHTQVIVGKPGE